MLDTVASSPLAGQARAPLFLDLETYFDDECSLKKMSTWEYNVHPLSHPQCVILDDPLVSGGIETRLLPRQPAAPGSFDETPAAHLKKILVEHGYEHRPVIAHNGAFDFSYIRYHTGLVPGQCVCTMMMDQYLNGSAYTRTRGPKRYMHGQSLEDCYQTYVLGNGEEERQAKDRRGLFSVMGKHPQDLGQADLEAYLVYAHQDVEKLRAVWEKMDGKIPAIRRYFIDWALRQMCDPVLRLDHEKLRHHQELQDQEVKDYMDSQGIEASQLRSSAKFKDIMDAIYPGGWPTIPSPSDPGKQIALASKAHPEWKRIYNSPYTPPDVVRMMDLKGEVSAGSRDKRNYRYARIAKALGGAFPLHIVASGAHTHRPTGSDGSGGNPLNWPSEGIVRHCIEAPAGYVLFGADYSGFELRITRWMVRDHTGIDYILNDRDMYVDLFADAFGVDPMTVDDKQRFMGKIGQLSCLAADTPILTKQGWVPLGRMTKELDVWDGVEWVSHEGLVDQGVRRTYLYGKPHPIRATSDHIIFDMGEEKPISQRWEGTKPRNEQVYDLVNAGPRRRFMTTIGLVSNCQYGTGAERLGISLGIDHMDAMRIVDTFRKVKHPALPAAWRFCDALLNQVARSGSIDRETLGQHLSLPTETLIGFFSDKQGVAVVRWPSGTCMSYRDLHMSSEGLSYSSRGPGWSSNVYGALLVENLAQSLANEIMTHAQFLIEKELGVRVCHNIYDELVGMLPESQAEAYLPEIQRILEESYRPYWPDMPPLVCKPKLGRVYGDIK